MSGSGIWEAGPSEERGRVTLKQWALVHTFRAAVRKLEADQAQSMVVPDSQEDSAVQVSVEGDVVRKSYLPTGSSLSGGARASGPAPQSAIADESVRLDVLSIYERALLYVLEQQNPLVPTQSLGLGSPVSIYEGGEKEMEGENWDPDSFVESLRHMKGFTEIDAEEASRDRLERMAKLRAQVVKAKKLLGPPQ